MTVTRRTANSVLLWFLSVVATPHDPRAEAQSDAKGDRPAPQLLPEARLGDPNSGDISGRSTIAAQSREVRVGEPLDVEVRFHCDGFRSNFVYDPFFCSGESDRAAARVFDESGRYVGNALARVVDGAEDRERWRLVEHKTVVGRTVRVPTAKHTVYEQNGTGGGMSSIIQTLGEGNYLAQFVLCGRFIDRRDKDGVTRRQRVEDPTAEICCSNVLKISIYPQQAKQ